MLRHALLGTTVFTATLGVGQTALADITVDDARAAFTAHMESLGAQVIETAALDGAATVMTDNALLYRFPFGFGTMRVGMPDYRMIPRSDGTVLLEYPEELIYRIDVDIPSEGSGSLLITVTQPGYSGVVSGDAGDVTFTQSAESFTFSLKSVEGTEEFFDLNIIGQGQDYTMTNRIEIGEMVKATMTSQTGPIEMATAFTDFEGFVTTDTSQFGENTSTIETAFPAGGSDILNLAPVFAAGAYLRGTIEDAGGSTETVTTIGNDILSEESQTTGATTSTFSIDKDGLKIAAETGPATFRTSMPDILPFIIEGSVGGGTGAFILPLLASAEPQDFGLQFSFDDLVLSEDIWSLVDATGDLPREAIAMNLDVAGTVISELDVFDIEALEAQMDLPVPPISLETLTVNELSVAALGASALATGAFSLDNTDTATFDGFPRPEGSAILNVSGANGLLDQLVAIGLLGSDEAGMARLGMGFIARSTGADAFETRLDVNAEGHVIVNGQRMR